MEPNQQNKQVSKIEPEAWKQGTDDNDQREEIKKKGAKEGEGFS